MTAPGDTNDLGTPVLTGGERSAAFDQYLAALDREDHAASGYGHVVEHAQAN